MKPGASTMLLSIPRRNGREYVRASDIFEALTAIADERFGAGGYVSALVLRQVASHQLAVSFEASARGMGSFTIRSGADELRGALIETGDPLSRFEPYDDAALIAAVRPGHFAASFDRVVDGQSPFDHLLAALKAATGDPDREAWLCQITLTRRFDAAAPLAVRLRQRALAFGVFEILQNAEPIGAVTARWRQTTSGAPE